MCVDREAALARGACAALAVVVLVLAYAGGASAAEVTGAADNLRTGWYPDEPALAPAQITEERFKQAFKVELKGQIYAQPLVANGTLLVVTEENWAYGLDPITGAVRWAKQLGTAVEAGAGKTISCEDLKPRVGITGTPVIDSEHNVAYFVSNRYVSGSSGAIGWYVHALDLTSGNEVSGFPVQITGESQNLPKNVKFEPVQLLERPALLLMNGVIYAGFGSHCDHSPFEGWIVGVSTISGNVVNKWVTTPGDGGSIWAAGTGLMSDGPGQILFSTGNNNGPVQQFEPLVGPGKQSPSPDEGRLAESVVRVEAQVGSELATTDFFSPFNSEALDEHDLDLGSSGPVGLPSPYFGTSKVPHLLVQSGKESLVYLINRDSLGGRVAAAPNNVVQELDLHSSRLHGGAGMFGGAGVWPGEGGYIDIAAGHLHFLKFGEESEEPHLSEAGETPDEAHLGSGSPIVTSDGTSKGSGVLWITWCLVFECEKAELRAYNPASAGNAAQPLWKTSIGFGAKFTRPYASDGHVYVGNHEGNLVAFSGPALTPSSESVQLAAPVGGQVSHTVTLTSTGSELEVSKVMAPSGPFEASGLPAPGTRLKPGDSVTVNIAFKPSAQGVARGELAVATQAGVTRVALTGNGEESAQERSEREARERTVALLGVAPTPPPASGAAPVELTVEPLLILTKLKVRAHASRLSSRRRKLAISYTLSAAGSVRFVFYQRVISHRCRPGVKTCSRWVATAVRLKVAARSGANVLAINLGSIRAGDYRLLATPVNRSGAQGTARQVDFKVLGAR
jgi:outer membrane protein assembly factor BamB